MKTIIALTLLIAAPLQASTDTQITERITSQLLAHGEAYDNLKDLTKIGHRLTGSKGAAQAVEWAKKKMEALGFDKVTLQPVTVNVWERGPTERASVISHKHSQPLRITALGGSVGTGKKPIQAPVIEVKTLDEATKLGDKAKGKIIFYNRPFDPTNVNTFKSYGEAVDQRAEGAWTAAQVGAVAMLVRSVTPSLDDHPHTGATTYKDDIKKIPAAALSTVAAEKLSALLKTDPQTQVKLELSAHEVGQATSYNVIGEITGSEKPEEIIDVGGHLDSWDLAQGAQDDGAGCVQSIEVLHTLKTLGLKPRRTIRAVLFMSEEHGLAGGKEYAKQAKEKKEKHLAAIESDAGGFTPIGFRVQENAHALDRLKSWQNHFEPIHAGGASDGHAGSDVGPLQDQGVALFGLQPDSQRYFDYHHAETDTMAAVNKRELHLGASAMTILAWLISENGL